MSDLKTKEFIVPYPALEAVLNYLAMRPFQEVSNLIQGFNGLKEYTLPAPTVEAPPVPPVATKRAYTRKAKSEVTE